MTPMMRCTRQPGNPAHAELRSGLEAQQLMAMPATTNWTADMVRALPDDGKRYEVIDGELFVTPAPTFHHQRAAFVLGTRLQPYVAAHGIGVVVLAPADVLAAEHVMVQPDVFVARLIEGRQPATWKDVGTPLLVAEILSPSTARADRQVKRRLYQRERVPEYWIVDVDARLLERWQLEDERPEILAERIEWRPDLRHPPLVIDLAGYFREVVDE
jgi:Uma2 family endonuclease